MLTAVELTDKRAPSLFSFAPLAPFHPTVVKHGLVQAVAQFVRPSVRPFVFRLLNPLLDSLPADRPRPAGRDLADEED